MQLFGYEDKVIVVTKGGDVINFDFDQQGLVIRDSVKRNNFITRLQGRLNAVCILQHANEDLEDEKIVYVGGDKVRHKYFFIIQLCLTSFCFKLKRV